MRNQYCPVYAQPLAKGNGAGGVKGKVRLLTFANLNDGSFRCFHFINC